jgi:hypothetical protein
VHAVAEQVTLRAIERLAAGQRKPESMRRSLRSVVGVRAERAVTADDPAQVAPFVVVGVARTGLEAAAAEQRASEREMWPPGAPLP